MRHLSASLVFLISASALAQTPAQQPVATKTGDSIVLYANRLDNSGCPVGFAANRQGMAVALTAAEAKQPGPAQGLHLMLDHPAAPAIESIEVTVYGVAPRQGIFPAGLQSSTQSPDTISKTFELHRKTDSSSLSEADVWMHNVGSLSRVDLIAVTYADGTAWHATESLKCRVTPSNLILVGATASIK